MWLDTGRREWEAFSPPKPVPEGPRMHIFVTHGLIGKRCHVSDAASCYSSINLMLCEMLLGYISIKKHFPVGAIGVDVLFKGLFFS